ncbi:MAG: hypothetical protein FJZ47_08310, partial [Candidatus Tectomicrobia bacterium]|nr:hypothetical protein [Candidatus Tectomicrobia bacterium]
MAASPDYRTTLVAPHAFWTTLSPTQIRQRIEHILAVPDSAALVQALSPVEYTVLLKTAVDMRPVLLQLGQPEQIRTVLDLDCWHKDTLQSHRVLEWLEALQQSGEEIFISTLLALDGELLSVVLRRHIRVDAALASEEEDEPMPYDEVLSNELYRIAFLDPDSPVNEQVAEFLRVLRLHDLDLYHRLMQEVMWAQEGDLEELAYRWKTGRLQDEGIPDYYEALESYHVVDLETVQTPVATSLTSPGIPASAEESGLVPSYAWGLTPSGSLLAEALRSEFSADTLERLCWEMVALCNKAIALDQVDFADTTAVRMSLGRVHAYVNIGLEYLSGQERSACAVLLTQRPLLAISQVGFTLSMRLRQRAISLQVHLNRATGVRRALPGTARHVLDGLLQ